MSDYEPQTLGERYLIEVLRTLHGDAIGRHALVEAAVARWESARGDAVERAVKTSLDRLLDLGVIRSEERLIERGVGTYIRLN